MEGWCWKNLQHYRRAMLDNGIRNIKMKKMREIPVVNLVEMAHLILLSLWGGVVLTEAVIELYPYKNRALHGSSVTLHYYIDILVEAPLLLGVLITGIVLVFQVNLVPLHYLLIACGLIAVGMNFTCIVLVIKRRAMQEQGQSETILWQYTRYIITTAALGIPTALIAAYVGFTLGHQRLLNLINGVIGK